MEVSVNNNRPCSNSKTSHLMNQKCAAANAGPNIDGKSLWAPFCSRALCARCRKTSVFGKKNICFKISKSLDKTTTIQARLFPITQNKKNLTQLTVFYSYDSS